MKLCQDCKFFKGNGKCDHDSATILDYVHGNHEQAEARIHRHLNGEKDCGHEARFFEPAVPSCG